MKTFGKSTCCEQSLLVAADKLKVNHIQYDAAPLESFQKIICIMNVIMSVFFCFCFFVFNFLTDINP